MRRTAASLGFVAFLAFASLVSVHAPATAAPADPAAFRAARRAEAAERLEARLAQVRAFAARASGPAAARPAPPGGGLDAGVDAWIGDGLPLCDPFFGQVFVRAVSDAAGGATFLWVDARGGKSEIFGRRLDATGNPASGWPANGLAVAARTGSVLLPEGCPDATGGAFVAFTQLGGGFGLDSLFLTRIQGNGTFGSGFGLTGAFVGGQAPAYWDLFADGTSVYVGWTTIMGETRVQRMTYAGAIAPGWPADGILIAEFQFSIPLIRPDGAGGVYVAYLGGDTLVVKRFTSGGANAVGWAENGFRPLDEKTLGRYNLAGTSVIGTDLMLAWEEFGESDSGIRAARVTTAAALASGWTSSGLVVVDEADNQNLPRLVTDAAGGAIAAWLDFRSGATDLYAMRMNANGTLNGTWPAGGLQLSGTGSEVSQFDLELDGSGGAVCAWSQGTGFELDVYGQRMTSAGAIASGWPASGSVLCDVDGRQEFVSAAPSGGGLIVAWDDERDMIPRVYAGRVDANGIVPAQTSLVSASAANGRVSLHWYVAGESGFEAAVERSAEDGPWIEKARLRPDGRGHLFWEDADVTAGRRYAYRLSAEVDGVRETFGEVTIRVPESSALALAGFRPNPPSGRFLLAFSLPSAADARIEVVDVSGRRVLERELSGLGAGEHVVELPEIGTLRPGLFFVTLEQSGRRATTRLVRTE